MNKLEEKKIELVDTLMEHYSFDELSKAEQAIVLEVLKSPSEYNEMKEVNKQLSKIKRGERNVPVPNPRILKNLKEKYFHDHNDATEPHAKTRNLFVRKLSFPVYQMGAAAIFLLTLFFAFREPVQFTDPEPIIREVFVRDTIKVMQPNDTVFIEKVIYQKSGKPGENLAVLNKKIETTETGNVTKSMEFLKSVNKQKGFSLKEKEYLLSLNVEAD